MQFELRNPMVPFISYEMSETCLNTHLNYKHYPMISLNDLRGRKYRISQACFDISSLNFEI